MRTGAQVADCAGVDVLTIPTKAAAEYCAQPRGRVASQVALDPEVPLAPGVTLAQFDGNSLWQVTGPFKEAVESLLRKDLDPLTPDALAEHFEATGLRGFLPRWSAADIETVTKEGKIPRLPTWQSRLAAGDIGLDALMNLSALQSFVTDQDALDKRIRSLLR